MKIALPWGLILTKTFKTINPIHLEMKVEAITVLVQKTAQTASRTASPNEEEKAESSSSKNDVHCKEKLHRRKSTSGERQPKLRKTSSVLMQNAENFMAVRAV
jgi:hypothetical protein